MSNFVQTAARDEKGFTLVELAVVMIIVGLLIGGILKGQEMITNAQVTSTIAQGKAFDAAISTFRDQYQGMPGDINGANRLSNCGAVCALAGNGDNQIGTQPGAVQATLNNENGSAWAQLSAAQLITGIEQSAATGDAPTPGLSIPEASISRTSWQIGFIPNATAPTGAATTEATRGGTYLLLDNSLAAVASAATASLTPNQAQRIDTKLDDGSPNTGSVLATGSAAGAAPDCTTGTAGTDRYNEDDDGTTCGVLYRVQG